MAFEDRVTGWPAGMMKQYPNPSTYSLKVIPNCDWKWRNISAIEKSKRLVDCPQQARLSGAVAANHANPFPGGDGQEDAIKDDEIRVGEAEVRGGQDGHEGES